MPCVAIKCRDGTTGILCLGGKTYDYDGHFFEVHRYFGPVPLNRQTWEARVRIPKSFWPAWERFEKLSPEEQHRFEV
jgi:hypothetical protein